MKQRRLASRFAGLCVTWLMLATASAQTPTAPSGDSGPVFKSNARLVLVDAVVTDKKGKYVHDLTQKDFHVFEDNKEQEIKSFSFEADPQSSGRDQSQYMVLFFDNSSMQLSDQLVARKAATQFIEANAGPRRYMAIVNFGGSMKVAQNFTTDAERLKKVAAGISVASIAMEGTPGVMLSPMDGNFTAQSEVLALRALARGMSSIPGRKSLIFLSAGFPLNEELLSQVTAAVDACNKANVAIYSIDVRGLATGVSAGAELMMSPVFIASADLQSTAALIARLLSPAWFQHGGGGGGGGGHGGGGGGGGGTGGGHSGGGTGGGGGARGGGGGRGPASGSGYNPMSNPMGAPRGLLSIPDTLTNQSVMHLLADGTGGFVIANTNDLLSGLQKIASEQNEYYLVGYVPEESKTGTCHTLKVKVGTGNTVRSRSGYCDVKPVDLLSGKPEERALEARAKSAQAGGLKASMLAPYFYTSPNTARVNVAIEMPGETLEFVKEKGKLHSTVNVLGIAYKADGSVAARFSDTVNVEAIDKKAVAGFQSQQLHYEDQFEIAPGQYTLKVVFQSGDESFGKIETPLTVDAYDGKTFTLSSVALSHEVRPISQFDFSRDQALLEDKTPLVAQGVQVTPTGLSKFKKGATAAAYIEIYDPFALNPKPGDVGLQLRIVDRKTGEQKQDTGFMNMTKSIQPGSSVVPIGIRLPIETLAAGSYRAELRAVDSMGHKTGVRVADFDLE